jgi:hypothetical protein
MQDGNDEIIAEHIGRFRLEDHNRGFISSESIPLGAIHIAFDLAFMASWLLRDN